MKPIDSPGRQKMNDIASEILKRASEGNAEALEEVYKAVSGFIYNVALRITRNGADAEEVTQDAFMKIYHNLKGFQFRSAFKTWVYRITVNEALMHYRRSKNEKESRANDDNAIDSLPDGRSTDEGAVHSENEERLNTLLSAVSPEHKACLVLREIEGLSYQEIAEILKVPINTVRTRLLRARQALLEEARKGLMTNAMR